MATDTDANAIPACRRVLVVEDNPDGRESMRMILTLLGHQVRVAENGVEGIRLADSFRPEVALVDIGLPDLDGFEVARQVRASLGPDVLLVAHTAYGDRDTRRRAGEAGFDAHLVKPVDLDDLARWLDSGRSVGSDPASLR